MSCRFSWRSKWNHSRFTGRVAAVLLQKAHQNSASQPTLRSLTVTKHPSFTILVCFWITYTLCVCVCVCGYGCVWTSGRIYSHKRCIFSIEQGLQFGDGLPRDDFQRETWDEIVRWPRKQVQSSLHHGFPTLQQTHHCMQHGWDNGQFCRHHNQKLHGDTMGNSADTTTRLHGDTMGSSADTTSRGYMVTQWAVLQTPQPEVTWWHNGQFCRHHNQRLHGDTMGSSADTTTRGYMVTQWAVLQTPEQGYIVKQWVILQTQQPEVTWWHNR